MADHIQKEKMTFREIFISYGAVIALAVLIVFNGIVTKNFLSLNTLWLVIKQSTPHFVYDGGYDLCYQLGRD